MKYIWAMSLIVFSFAARGTVSAQSSVSASVTVLERKSTDTINDFDFSSLSPSFGSGVAGNTDAGDIKGARESSLNSQYFFQKIIQFIKNIVHI